MKRCKKADLEMFQRGLNKNGENDKVVDPDTRIEEWSDWWGKSKGPKKGGKRQGIVRCVGKYSI